MRYGGIAAVAVLLAGCAADPSDIRAPRDDDERSAMNVEIARAAPVNQSLARANTDFCRAAMGAKCHLDVQIGASSRLGAFDGERAIGITVGLMQALKSPDEISLVVAHEWFHQFADHGHKGYGIKAETDADCVGAIMTVRAGYSLSTAKRAYTEVVANIDAGEGLLKVASLVLAGTIPKASEHPSAEQRAANLDRISTELAAHKARGEAINLTTLDQVCGVHF